MGYMGTHLSPDLAQSSQNKDRSVPIKLQAFCMKISLWLILYFWKNCRRACSQLQACSEILVFCPY